jgi:hypothetical protein
MVFNVSEVVIVKADNQQDLTKRKRLSGREDRARNK